jgi:hypothetical protein
MRAALARLQRRQAVIGLIREEPDIECPLQLVGLAVLAGGLASPDDGDALALTFAYPVAKRDWAEERRFDEALQKLKRWVV